jgi:energy-coupling factor transporter ATP-binding protein EcfA2
MNLDGPPPVIKLQDLTKVFSMEEVETHALSNVSVQIERGEYVSIAGPSGCGKSTLLSILGLLDSPTQGSYELNGRPVAELRASERARVRNREIGLFIFATAGSSTTERSGMSKKADVWQGTLALMILKTLETLGPQHGYGIARRIEQTSGQLLLVNYGTLYPALLKLEQEDYIKAAWRVGQ